MWFITLVAIVAIIWFLYVIAQNSGENLQNQREILRELKDIRSEVSELSKLSSSMTPPEKQQLPSIDAGTDQAVQASKLQNEEFDGDSHALVNINTAGLNELQSLPGVGKVVAQKIIDARPYDSIESLEAVPGVSSELLNKLKLLVTL